MNIVSLNLARKLRSQNFDQIIGQDLVVRILKNSLYRGHYFPVYLFAGQRGCGKTTTARVFAAALNCLSLPDFQKDPKNNLVPCLTCDSCISMHKGNHPDFIEIDAASHTGVDNIRAIIDSSSLLPLMGRKRVYLIDEAHMLSKAAFNALLKILEEPPACALFILATTNQQKIIETVRSRCFQLFFIPVVHNVLQKYLKDICNSEGIAYDDAAHDIIIRQSEGSVRDALNLLETVRFSSSVVNKESVLRVLGHIGDEQVIQIIEMTLAGQSSDLLKLFQILSTNQYCAEIIWQRLMLLLRGLIWLKHGVSPQVIIASTELLEVIAKKYSLTDIHHLIEVLYNHEGAFLKTTSQHALLEMVLLGVCQKKQKKSYESGGAASTTSFVLGNEEIHHDGDQEAEESDENNDQDKDQDDAYSEYGEQWVQFVTSMSKLNDQLVASLFKQACYKKFDPSVNTITIEFAQDLIFFEEWLTNTKNVWQPELEKFFSAKVSLVSLFTGAKTSGFVSSPSAQTKQEKIIVSKAISPTEVPVKINAEKSFVGQQQRKKTNIISFNNEIQVDVSDVHTWKAANLLLRYFPGSSVTEVREHR